MKTVDGGSAQTPSEQPTSLAASCDTQAAAGGGGSSPAPPPPPRPPPPCVRARTAPDAIPANLRRREALHGDLDAGSTAPLVPDCCGSPASGLLAIIDSP